MAAAAPQRQSQLDGLRGVAALMVVLGHPLFAFDHALLTGKPGDSVLSWDIVVSGAPLLLPFSGNLAVTIFFALSGYVLAHAFSRSELSAVALLAKRYVRFAVPILTVCLFAYALLASGAMHNHALAAITRSSWLDDQFTQTADFGAALREGLYLALLKVLPPTTSYDSSLWTMPIEFFGSLGMIAVFRLTAWRQADPAQRRRERIAALAGLGVLFGTSYLGLFAWGALLNLTGIERHVRPRQAALLLAVGVFLGTIPVSAAPWLICQPFLALARLLPAPMPFSYSPAAMCHAAGAIMILIAANAWPPLRRLLNSGTAQFLGHISFPLYLVHVPLFMSAGSLIALGLLHADMPYVAAMATTTVLFTALSVAVSAALLVICERPAITLAQRAGVLCQRVMVQLRCSAPSTARNR